MNFKEGDRRELRDTIFKTELQGVVLRVNYPYAQSAELTTRRGGDSPPPEVRSICVLAFCAI